MGRIFHPIPEKCGFMVLASVVSNEKLAVIVNLVPLYIICLFLSTCFQNFVFLFSVE